MRIKLSVALETLVTLTILVLLIFRILIWWRAEGTQGKFVRKGEKVQSEKAEEDAACCSLTFCNANSFRATALYTAGVYDKVSQTALDPLFTPDSLDLTTDQLQQYSHSISSMLKRCKFNNEVCDAQQFEAVRTKHGICYQLHLSVKSRSHLEIILDPEENEYVLPNDGFTGFIVLLNHSSVDQGDFFIGTGLHNIVRLSAAHHSGKMSCEDPARALMRVDSVTQSVKSALYQSLLPHEIAADSTTDTSRGMLSRLIQQRAFLRAMNRSAFEEVVRLAHQLTSIRVAVGFINDFMRQTTHALRVETAIMVQQRGCGADLHNIAAKFLVDLLEAQERWSDESAKSIAGLIVDSPMLSNTSAGADVELSLVECFFAAQNIGTRLKSYLRDLIRSLLEIGPSRNLGSDRRGSEYASTLTASSPSLSSREVFQPLSANDLLATGNATICKRVQEIYRARTTILNERASSVVALIDRLNLRLHSLTADNRETRAHFALSQPSRHNSQVLASKYVTASISIKEEEACTFACLMQHPSPMYHLDHLIGILTSTIGLWISLVLVIELHLKNFRSSGEQILQLQRLPGCIENLPDNFAEHDGRNQENNAHPSYEGAYEHCGLFAPDSLPPKLVRLNGADPPEMWLTLPQSTTVDITTHSLRKLKTLPTIHYEHQALQNSLKIPRNHGSLLHPSASSSTQTVVF